MHGPYTLAPRYIQRYTTAPDDALRIRLIREYGVDTAVWGIACPCGHHRFRAVGRELPRRDTRVGGPINLQCAGCDSQFVLIDPERHGFEGAVGTRSQSSMPTQPWKAVACPNCSGDVFSIAAGYQYAGEDEGFELGDAHDLHAEDVFGWFAAQCRCAACGVDFEMASIECA